MDIKKIKETFARFCGKHDIYGQDYNDAIRWFETILSEIERLEKENKKLLNGNKNMAKEKEVLYTNNDKLTQEIIRLEKENALLKDVMDKADIVIKEFGYGEILVDTEKDLADAINKAKEEIK